MTFDVHVRNRRSSSRCNAELAPSLQQDVSDRYECYRVDSDMNLDNTLVHEQEKSSQA